MFGEAKASWNSLKNNVIKFYGIKGKDYKSFEECFRNGEWYLSRMSVDLNKTRMQDILREISMLMKGKTKEFESGDKGAVFGHLKELYEDMIENYRIIFSRVAKHEYVKECRAYADILGDDLMELRDMEVAFNKLGNHSIYIKYNAIRRQVGQCESILPRLGEAFRTAQVKSMFQQRFGDLFALIEDLLAPVQEQDFAPHEEKIKKMWEKNKSINEIATELGLNANLLAVYIEKMITDKKITKKE
jgi:hypothetical protein